MFLISREEDIPVIQWRIKLQWLSWTLTLSLYKYIINTSSLSLRLLLKNLQRFSHWAVDSRSHSKHPMPWNFPSHLHMLHYLLHNIIIQLFFRIWENVFCHTHKNQNADYNAALAAVIVHFFAELWALLQAVLLEHNLVESLSL